MSRFAWWVADLRWSANMRRARSFRRRLNWEEREIFDKELTAVWGGDIYRITVQDVVRAAYKAKGIERALRA